MKTHKKNLTKLLLAACFFLSTMSLYPQKNEVASVHDATNILPVREQEELMNDILEWRLENLLPKLMRREGIDMWLILNKENNEDPVYMTLVPKPNMTARRSYLVFHDPGKNENINRYDNSKEGMKPFYNGIPAETGKSRLETLINFIKKENPQKIGLNISSNWAQADGLSASLKEELSKALDPELASRLVSAERLCTGWLETRSPLEISVYRHLCGIAHDIIAEFFSNKVIIPDVTTAGDVKWWIRQKVNDLGLETWFQPDIFIARCKDQAVQMDDTWAVADYYHKEEDDKNVIKRGDLLHCDFGIVYLGLHTDMQWEAYVCRVGEDDAPKGIKEALKKARQMAEIFMGEFKAGKTGSEIAFAAMQKGLEKGLRPYIYSHPLGYHGHGAGTGLYARSSWGKPLKRNNVRSEYPLHFNTIYAIEFQILTSIPEWGNQDIRWGFEEDGVFTENGCQFIDGHQTKILLIK
jgi:Xaa-Pro aminopeptidase